MENGSMIGPYRIDGLLGRGGMAEVYKAWHTGLHRHEALKVPMPVYQDGVDAVFVQRFLNEARIAAGLHHPHIATIFSVSDAGVPQPFFSMELIEGNNLEDLISQNGRLSLDDTLGILSQVGEALDHAHGKGVVHRDIKPGNILLERAGNRGILWNAKVVDFGIARASEELPGKRMTKAGMVVGTPEYMSPEQAGSGPDVDYRTDIYSLGIVAYEMLCGYTPFGNTPGASAISIIMQHMQQAPRPLLDFVPGLPPGVNDAILRALSKNPADRPPSCAAWIASMRPAPVTTMTPSPFAPVTTAGATPDTQPMGTSFGTPPMGVMTPAQPQGAVWPQSIPAMPSGSIHDTMPLPPDAARNTLPDKTTDPIAASGGYGGYGNYPGNRVTNPPPPGIPGATMNMAPGAAIGMPPAAGTPLNAGTGGMGQGGMAQGGMGQGTMRRGGSDAWKIALPLILGSGFVLVGIVALRGSGPPAPSNGVGGPTMGSTAVPGTTPFASASGGSASNDETSNLPVMAPTAGDAPGNGFAVQGQMQAEVEAQQARTLINNVVTNLMRVRQLQEKGALKPSEAQAEKTKVVADLEEARQHSTKALSLDITNKMAHIQQVRALFYLGQYALAQSVCLAALQRFPGNGDLTELRGKIEAKLHKS